MANSTPLAPQGRWPELAWFANGIPLLETSEHGLKHSIIKAAFAAFGLKRMGRRSTTSSTRMVTMSNRAEHPPAAPSRAEVEEKLRGLIEGRYSREAVTSWAEQWVMAKAPNVQDGAVWRALTALSGADLIST